MILYGHSRNLDKAAQVTGLARKYLLPKISVDVINQHKITAFIHLAGIAHDLTGKYNEQDYIRLTLKTRDVFMTCLINLQQRNSCISAA